MILHGIGYLRLHIRTDSMLHEGARDTFTPTNFATRSRWRAVSSAASQRIGTTMAGQHHGLPAGVAVPGQLEDLPHPNSRQDGLSLV
jgi:hypothetical protein